MAISWKSHGVFTLDHRGMAWSIEVARAILEGRAGRPLRDPELNTWAADMADELREAAIAKVESATGPKRWVQLEPGDAHVPD